MANNGAGSCQGGISRRPVDGVTIDNMVGWQHDPRGIVIWNGFKTDITITNNTVTNNNCCGIELQDGTASRRDDDRQHGDRTTPTAAWPSIGLMAGAGPNLIANNTLNNNGRFGIEIKLPNGTGAESGDGSIVVRDNTVSGQPQSRWTPGRSADLGGIVVIRRAWVAGNNNVDIPRRGG